LHTSPRTCDSSRHCESLMSKRYPNNAHTASLNSLIFTCIARYSQHTPRNAHTRNTSLRRVTRLSSSALGVAAVAVDAVCAHDVTLMSNNTTRSLTEVDCCGVAGSVDVVELAVRQRLQTRTLQPVRTHPGGQRDVDAPSTTDCRSCAPPGITTCHHNYTTQRSRHVRAMR
jgi:hypothetical protein